MTTADPLRVSAQTAPRERWRAVALLVAELLLVAVPFELAYGFAMRLVYRSDALTGLTFAVLAVLVLFNAYALWARFVARRAPDELSTRRIAGLGAGALVGAALMGAIVAILAACGALQVGTGSGIALAGLPGVAVLAGVAEELIARGVLLRNLENVFGSIAAIALTAAMFGWMHLDNPNATPLGAAAIGIEGGVMLAAVYVATRSLWWTIGIHIAWNLTQTTLFGIADSGHPGGGLLRSETTGPQWLTGGEFGVEASFVSVVVCALVAIAFLFNAWRGRRFVKPIWMRDA